MLYYFLKTRLVGGLTSVKRLYDVSRRNIFKISVFLKHLQTVVNFFSSLEIFAFISPPREVHLQMLEATIKLE